MGTGTVMFILAVVVSSSLRFLSRNDSVELIKKTQHLGFDIQRAMEGFITHGGSPDGSFDFFKLLNNALFVGKAIAYITQTLVGDTFVVCLPTPSRASTSTLD